MSIPDVSWDDWLVGLGRIRTVRFGDRGTEGPKPRIRRLRRTQTDKGRGHAQNSTAHLTELAVTADMMIALWGYEHVEQCFDCCWLDCL